MTCRSCHQNKLPKVIKYDYFIMLLGRIILKNKRTPICYDKMTHLTISCVTMKELLDKFHETIELSDVLCEYCSSINSKISNSRFEKYQSVLSPSLQLRIFLQISKCNGERDDNW